MTTAPEAPSEWREVLRGYGLSPRQLDVADLVMLGYTGPEICGRLHIDINTYKTHQRRLREKMGGCRDRLKLNHRLWIAVAGHPVGRSVDDVAWHLATDPRRCPSVPARAEAERRWATDANYRDGLRAMARNLLDYLHMSPQGND